MPRILDFFKNAFRDMKANAQAQHVVDKANFAAAKAEARANFAEARANSDPAVRRAADQKKRDRQLAEAEARTQAANLRVEAAKKN